MMMKAFSLLVSVLVTSSFAAPGVVLVGATAAEDDANHHHLPPPRKQPEVWQDELVSWLMSKPNGYYSHKIQWQKTPELGNSYNMYAVEDISKDETIMIIPQSAIMGSNGTNEECITVANMMQEYDKGPESQYYPYIKYLFGDGYEGGTSTGLLPTTWSQSAKDLLANIVGKKLEPRKIEMSSVFEQCDGQWKKKFLESMDRPTKQRYEDAYIFWVCRSWTDKMVPILDMINHRNGKWLNVESTTAHSGKDIQVYAKRDIVKGEQLYSKCPLYQNTQYKRFRYEFIMQTKTIS